LGFLRGTWDHLYSQGRWWFGTRQKTKDGVYTSTAASFFKSLRPESDIDEVVGTLVRSFEWEGTMLRVGNEELHVLEESIEKSNIVNWAEMKRLACIAETGDEGSLRKRRALILLYAHMLRLQIVDSSLQAGLSTFLSSSFSF
jgi:translocation protein SEC63